VKISYLHINDCDCDLDFYREPWHGGIDSATGFALVTSYQTCFVWQHTQVYFSARFRVHTIISFVFRHLLVHRPATSSHARPPTCSHHPCTLLCLSAPLVSQVSSC
jgi:hypothetical protein